MRHAPVTLLWFKKSAEDEEMCRRALNPPPLTDAAAFHAQQAAEKAIKGFLNAVGIAPKLTHNLPNLLDQMGKHHRRLRKNLYAASYRLSGYAVDARYPVPIHSSLSLEQAKHAVKQAGFICKSLRDSLGLSNAQLPT